VQFTSGRIKTSGKVRGRGEGRQELAGATQNRYEPAECVNNTYEIVSPVPVTVGYCNSRSMEFKLLLFICFSIIVELVL